MNLRYVFRRFVACAAFLMALSASNLAAEELKCTDLPAVAWDGASLAKVRVVVDVVLPRVTSAKELYLNAMCGAQPAAIWDLVLRGQGALLEIPSPLANALDKAVPYMPRVDYMYVRGGGADREIVVFLFANGYEGPFFELDVPGEDNPWTQERLEHVAPIWNALPYESLRRASHWLHDIALFRNSYSVHLRALWGLIDLEVFEMQQGRALANPLGTLFMAENDIINDYKWNKSDTTVWIHELGHYVDYALHGMQAFAWAPEGTFQGISKENNRVLGIAIPFWMKERREEAVQWREAQGGCEAVASDAIPWGYVSKYGLCGEWAIEDFADSFVVAMGVTQVIRDDEFSAPWAAFGPDPFDDHRLEFQAERLYARGAGTDGGVLAEKADYLYSALGVHDSLPQDADADSVVYEPGQDVTECSDINPVYGQCMSTGCSFDSDCDDGDACTVDVCRGGTCDHDLVDTDADGSPDGACGGGDCADTDPAIRSGTERTCTGACNIGGVQYCVGGSWTECSAPATCECDPTEPPQVIPCGNCGTQLRECNPDGTWSAPSACEPIDASADGCQPGEMRTFTGAAEGCSDRTCDGRSIERYREETCDAQCNWQETLACTLTQPTSAEICNGDDDDCDKRTDEGCPQGLTFSRLANQPLLQGNYPYGSGYANEGNCASNEVLVGLRLTDGTFSTGFSTSKVIAGVRPICRDLTLATNQSGAAYSYDLQTSNTRYLPVHGKYTQYHAQYICPSGQAIQGLQVELGWFVDRIKIHCGDLDVSGSIGSYQLVRYSGSSSPIYFHGTSLDASQTCQQGSVATGLRTRTGDVLDAIGLNCSKVSLDLK